MASFTDKLQPFNPYVSQLPIEAMVSVGTTKQGQYNEGVQKIQASIDNVAGLDIYRDVDKNYLQSRLNSLGNNLKAVAAADFSNQQLSQSVSRLASNIGRDQKVQAAVMSTSKARKEIGKLESDRTAGKLSPANEDYFGKRFSEWVNNTEVGAPLTAEYIPHYDVDKHIRDTFNAIKPDGYTIDEIFQTDSDGKRVYKEEKDPKTGQVRKIPVLSTTMTELKKKGMFPEKVEQTINQIFNDPNVAQQLQIDGEYNYKGYSPVALAERTIQLRDNELKLYDDRISLLNIKKNATTDLNEKEAIQAQIDRLSATRTNIYSSYNSMLSAVTTNPDTVRGILYKKEAKNNYISMYTSIEEESSIKENPAWRAEFDIMKEANDLAIRQEDMRYKWTSLRQADTHFYTKLNADLAVANAKNKEGVPSPTIEPVDANVSFINDWQQHGEEAIQSHVKNVDDVIFSSGVIESSVVDGFMKTFGGATLEQARDFVIKAKAKAEGLTPDAYRNKWYNQAIAVLKQHPEKLSLEMRGKVSSAQNSGKVASDYLYQKAEVDSYAPEPDVMKNLGDITVTMTAPWNIFQGGGETRRIILTPELQRDISLAHKGDLPAATKDLKDKAKLAQKRLEAQGISKDDVASIINTVIRDITSDVTGKQPKVKREFINLLKSVDESDNLTAYERRANYIKTFYKFNPTYSANIMQGKTELVSGYSENLKGLIGKYKAAGQNESTSFISNASDMMTVAEGKEGGTVSLVAKKNEVTGKVTPVVRFIGPAGENIGEMTITEEEARLFNQDVSSWFTPNVVKNAEMKLKLTKNNTTAFNPIDDPYTYQIGDVVYTKDTFPGLKSVPQDVMGNVLKQTLTAPGGEQYDVYRNYLYINPLDGTQPFVRVMPNESSTMDNALQIFDQLTPQFIQAAISEHAKQSNKK